MGCLSHVIGCPHLTANEAGIIRKMGNGPILTVEAFEVAAGHEHGIAFRWGRVECGRRHLRQCHSADPGFARKTVNPATVFAQGAIFQIIIFHFKDDENPQFLNLNSPLLVGVKRKSRLSGQRGMNSNKV